MNNIDKIVELFLLPPNKWNNEIIGFLFSSGCVMLIMIVLIIIINIKARFADPLKKPKGILFLFESGVKMFDNLCLDIMGKHFDGFGGFMFGISGYLLITFMFGLTGLPSPMTNLAVPLSLGLTTFLLIHITAIRTNKWKYFKRYIDPIPKVPLFLPINLLSMWSPLISLSFRLFGNAIAGWTLMTLVYYALRSLSEAIFSFLPSGINQMLIAPIIAPILHLYFDLFSAFIQTVVFCMLSMMLIGQEGPDDEEEISKATQVKSLAN